MIEFVGLPPNLENHIRGCHGNHAFSRSPYHFFNVFINIHEYANYANMVRCIFDNGMKGLCLSFTNFSNLRLKAAEILLILYVYPHS